MSDDELKALHDKHFEAGVEKAKATQYFARQAPAEQALRITNEVCDFVYREVGTYGRDEKQRKAMDAYVKVKALQWLECEA